MATVSGQAELEQFLIEKLQQFDPTIDTSKGSSAYTLVIAPTIRRMGSDPLAVDIETFILQRLKDTYPSLDVTSPGSSIRDLLVLPLIALLEPLRTEIAHVRRQLSIADVDTMSASELDSLLANSLSSRSTGQFAAGSVRIFFSSTRQVGVDQSIVATTNSGIKYLVDEVRTYLPSEMLRLGNLWYIDVPVRAAIATTAANIAANTMFSITGIDGVVKATNPRAISGGITESTNEEYFDRALVALSERSLNTERGIKSFINENTSDVTSADVVGFGDALMQRDVLTSSSGPITITGVPGGVPFPGSTDPGLTIQSGAVHIGGCTDVYIKTAAPTTDEIGDIQITGDYITSLTGIVFTDVTVVAGTNEVACPGLGAAVGTVGVGTYRHVLEFENWDGSYTPTAVRVITALDADTVRVDGSFSDSLAGQRARLVSSVKVDLAAPKRILQVGLLTTYSDSVSVLLADNIGFTTDPAATPVYLEILTSSAAGEYRVVRRMLNTLVLDRVPALASSGLLYRVYTKQESFASLPLLQCTRVFLSDDDAGTDVPYAHPINVTFPSIAARISTPLTSTDLGALSLTVSSAVITCSAPYSFIAQNVQVGDLLKVVGEAYSFRIVAVTDATHVTVERTYAGAVPLTTTEYVLGPPTYANAEVLFKDPTFFACSYHSPAAAGTLLYMEQDSGATLSFTAARTEEGYVYAPQELLTHFQYSAAGKVSSANDDVQALGMATGDLLEVQAKVLVSTVFTDVEEVAIILSGMFLTFTVDQQPYVVRFSDSGAYTLSQVASTINQQVGTYVYAERVDLGADTKYLRIYARKHLVLADVGTGTALANLKLGSDYDNRPAGLAGEYAIAALYTDGTAVELSSNISTTVGTLLLIAVKRTGSQFVFPADMEKQVSGLYKAVIRVESLLPIAADALPANAHGSISSYASLGYDYEVANPEYSFSVGEQVYLRFTATFLPSTAKTLAELLTAPKSVMSLTYEHAPQVATLQTEMLRSYNRVTNSNILVRHYFPAYPSFGVVYQGSEELATVQARVEDFLLRLYPSASLEVYDLLGELSKLRISSVQSPIEVGYLKLDKNRLFVLDKSLNNVELDKSYHVMAELDYVAISKG